VAPASRHHANESKPTKYTVPFRSFEPLSLMKPYLAAMAFLKFADYK